MAEFSAVLLQIIILCGDFIRTGRFWASTGAENPGEARKLFCTWNFRGILNDINKFSEPYTSPLISGISREGYKPVNVYLELHVQTIVGLSTSRGLFEVDVFVSEIWQDKHFNFLSAGKIDDDNVFANVSLLLDEMNDNDFFGGSGDGVENDKATAKSAEKNFTSTPYQSSPLYEEEFCRSYLNLGADVEKEIFTPNVNIWNSKMAKIHKSPTVNKFINVYADGTIWRNHRMKVQAPCQFDIKMYPFDAVECELIFQSYSYGSEDLNLSWHKNFPVTFVNEVSLADYDFINFTLEKSVTKSHIAGSWDQLKIVFYFRRRFGFYFLQVYLPSSITVAMAWTAFFFEAKYSSTRVTIGINALLALSFQFDNMDIPRASQVKGYEVWMFMCMTFIFVSLAELAAALRVITKSKRNYLNVSCGASLRHSYEKVQTSVKTVENSMLNSKKIDQYSMILLPLIFLIGNIFYWFYYVNYMFFE